LSVYDALAPSFDRQRALPQGVPAAIRRSVLGSLSTSRPRLLDLGCGSGRIGVAFMIEGDDYVGVDLSFGMLHTLATRHDLAAGAVALLAQADGEHLPFLDAGFDAVLLMQVLSAARDWRSLLAESARVLRHSGSLIVGRMVAPEDGVDTRMRQRLRKILNAIGVQPSNKQATHDALAWLSRTARMCRSVVVAYWMEERTPRQFLERHGSGARFSALPTPVRDAALRQVREWATASFGSLDVTFNEVLRYELSFFNL
jgi:demethylmenaquinone methyltransferase/2-methoxy-6-polyprenyl-1,4-benzoquinol methylase